MDSALAGKYEGETENGRYHGRGKIVFADSTYEGTFFDGQKHGEGKMTVKSKIHPLNSTRFLINCLSLTFCFVLK